MKDGGNKNMIGTENKAFSLDAPLEKRNTAKLLDKKSLVRKVVEFEIVDVRMGKWDKLQVVLKDPAHDEYALDINNQMHNDLMELFGKTPKGWLYRKVKLSSKSERFIDRVTGEEKSGFGVFIVMKKDPETDEGPENLSDNGEELEEEDL